MSIQSSGFRYPSKNNSESKIGGVSRAVYRLLCNDLRTVIMIKKAEGRFIWGENCEYTNGTSVSIINLNRVIKKEVFHTTRKEVKK